MDEIATLEIKRARAARPIHEVLAARWSPYGFADRGVPGSTLHTLFEAARWSASSFNEQPWFFVVARREEGEAFGRVLGCLIEFNQSWARFAPALAICGVRQRFERNDKPNPAAEHDLGLATASLMFEATAHGLRVHAMIGIEKEVARERLAIPEGWDPLTAVAIGYPGLPAELAEKLRERDRAPRERKSLAEFVHGGRFGAAADFLP